MAYTNTHANSNGKKGVNPLGAAIIGGAVGAAAMWFADKKNQKMATEKLNSLQKDLDKTVNKWLKQVDEVREDVTEKVEDTKEVAVKKSHEVLGHTKDALDKADKLR